MSLQMEVFREHRKMVGWAWKVLGSRQDAEDVVQDMWVRLLNKGVVAVPLAWSTLHHRVVDIHRHRKEAGSVSLEQRVLDKLRCGPRMYDSLWRHVGGEPAEYERAINSLTERGEIGYVEGKGYDLATEEKGVSA